MRQYQPIWEAIKKRGKATLEVHPALFERVKKAVIKEKWRDLGFKLINDHDTFFLTFSFTLNEKNPQKSRMVIELKQTLGIEDRRPA